MNEIATKHVVGVSDLKMSKNPEDQIITYALGSCIAVVVYDPVAVVGGMLHFQLPQHMRPEDGTFQDMCKYADTGVPYLFKTAYSMGAKKNRMVVSVLGGGRALSESHKFDIGKRNYIYLRKLLWKNNVFVANERIENTSPMTVWLEMRDGHVFVRMNGEVEEIA